MRAWVVIVAIVGSSAPARAEQPPPGEPPPGPPLQAPPGPGEPPPMPPGEPPTGSPGEPPTGDVGPAPGDPALGAPGASELEVTAADAPFGPLILIERVRVRGNRSTAERVIRRALPVRAGDRLRAGDPRLTRARFDLLALGYFRDVTLELEKGSARGQVILTVTVAERGTVALNRLWFGTSLVSPWWLGADLTERNFLGTGLAVGGGLAYADHAAVEGARDQWAGELRLGGAAIAGTR